MTALLDAVADAGTRLVIASKGRIRFDAREALSRADDLTLSAPGIWSSNRHCRLVACSDGWVAVSLARESDLELVPAWTGAGFDDNPWEAVVAHAATRTSADMVEAGIGLHLPVARLGEADASAASSLKGGADRGDKVIDLSALWAGPYCGGLLAEAGLDVTKVESRSRPDPTAQHTPNLDRRLNSRKRRIGIDIESGEVLDRIAAARILITSARPHALARLGIEEARLFAANPSLLWITITAHGWRGAGAMRVGFGDDCAAAGGLISWHDSAPRFIGDALADPLTGLTAATMVLEALEAGLSGLLDVSLAWTAATFAEAMR